MDAKKESQPRIFSKEKQRAIEKKKRQEFEIYCEGLQQLAMLMRYKALCAAQHQEEQTAAPFGFDFESLKEVFKLAEVLTAVFYDLCHFNPHVDFESSDHILADVDRFVLAEERASIFVDCVLYDCRAPGAVNPQTSPVDPRQTFRQKFNLVACKRNAMVVAGAVGTSLVQNIRENRGRTFCVADESVTLDGLFWEALALASDLRTSHLCLLIAVSLSDDAERLRARISAFGFAVVIIDGNDILSIIEADKVLKDEEKPGAIICQSAAKFGGIQLETWSDLRGSDSPCFRKVATFLGKAGSASSSIKERIYSSPSSEDGADSLVILVASSSSKALELAERLDGRVVQPFHPGCGKAAEACIGAAIGIAALLVPVVVLVDKEDMLRSSSAMHGVVQSLHGKRASLSIVAICGHPAHNFVAVDDIGMVRSCSRGINILRCPMREIDRVIRKGVHDKWGRTYISAYAMQPSDTVERGIESDGKANDYRIGGSSMLRQTLNDRCVLVCSGRTVQLCVDAQEELEALGVSVSVLDVYCLSPIDRWALLGAYGSSGCLIVVDEGFPHGGLASAVAEAVPVSAALGEISDRVLSTGPIMQNHVVEKVLQTLNIDPAETKPRVGGFK